MWERTSMGCRKQDLRRFIQSASTQIIQNRYATHQTDISYVEDAPDIKQKKTSGPGGISFDIVRVVLNVEEEKCLQIFNNLNTEC